jgi:MoxR-like ATPase
MEQSIAFNELTQSYQSVVQAEPLDIQQKIVQLSHTIQQVRYEINKVMIGQSYMIDRLLIGLFTGGHILLEGVPGLAKTLAGSTLAETVGLDFKRIQFTPDLLPADILGTQIYNQKSGDFHIKKGPIFANLVLADEINRAPAKVQSALLEAMQEIQVTIGDTTYDLEQPFMVIATQNPLEQQGTYALPEAQQDRFMLKLKVEYPNRAEERMIMERFSGEVTSKAVIAKTIGQKEIVEIRQVIDSIYCDEVVKNYILDIVLKTREASPYIACGASPRATLNLLKAAKAMAFLQGRAYVIPDDVKSVVYDVLRHRIILTYEAEAEDLTSDTMITMLLELIRLP